MRDPAVPEDAERQLLAELQAACIPAATAYPLLQALGRGIKEKTPEQLDDWLKSAAECSVPD